MRKIRSKTGTFSQIYGQRIFYDIAEGELIEAGRFKLEGYSL